MATAAAPSDIPAASPYALALRQALRDKSGKTLARFDMRSLEVEILSAAQSVWAIIRREGKGGLALRAAYLPGEYAVAKADPQAGEIVRLNIVSAMGEHVVAFRSDSETFDTLRMTVCLTPAKAVLIPFMPRDLYPLDTRDDPLGAKGHVEAAQRGLNGGILYFQLEKPAFGNVLYLQNLTAMNPYYRATNTKPDSAVGGEWPELGYLLPSPPQSGTPPTNALKPGETVTLSDAILIFRDDLPPHEQGSAHQFLQLLGVGYKMLDQPDTEYRDWLERSERTLRDLDNAPEATLRHYGHRYVHPYTGAEYPDIMVQMSIVAAIHDWGKWQGEPHPLKAEFKAGLEKFYDDKLKTLRRYLPNVGKDKDPDAVDSWYLYHPLLNLGRLALDGDRDAHDLFMKSIGFGIRAARHFKYKWPVQYKIDDFSVITQNANDGRGQTDVGGVYAWVMLQAFELTDDKSFLDEASAAIDAGMGLRFNVNYQANLTAWGAAACVRLWRITNKPIYLEQSYVYLASFLHNCELWESELDHAIHYRNFLGATCLQDSPYMAIYECFESFTAMERYLDDGGPDLEPAARMLVAEYCRYALDRAWYYYPDALPLDAIASNQREKNGHVDRKLSFPLEDLYPDGQQAGQVGQEIYGAGAAFVFATRAFHKLEGASFLLYCDQFIRTIERTSERSVAITLDGGKTCEAGLNLVRLKRHKLGSPKIAVLNGEQVKPVGRSEDRLDYRVPASGRLLINWD